MWVIFEVTGDLGVRCGHLEGLRYFKSGSLIGPVNLIPNMMTSEDFEVK